MTDFCTGCGAPMVGSGYLDEDENGNALEWWSCSKHCGDSSQEWRPLGRKMTDKERAIKVIEEIPSTPYDWESDTNTERLGKTLEWIKGLPNLTDEIARHRKTGILLFFSPCVDLFQIRYHVMMYNHHTTRAVRLTERGIGEFPGVDLRLTPYSPKIQKHLTIAREHMDAEDRILGRRP